MKPNILKTYASVTISGWCVTLQALLLRSNAIAKD
jgi:hypothetical protein